MGTKCCGTSAILPPSLTRTVFEKYYFPADCRNCSITIVLVPSTGIAWERVLGNLDCAVLIVFGAIGRSILTLSALVGSPQIASLKSMI